MFRTLLFSIAVFVSFGFPAFAADDDMPRNLGGGLRELANWHAQNAAALPQTRKREVLHEHVKTAEPRARIDAAGRVIVDVHLDGKGPAATVRAALEALGATVIAFEPGGRSSSARHGVFSIYLPVEQSAAAAKIAGVQSITLVHRPWRRAGSVNSQGVGVMKANLVQKRHFTGKGITVGVLSDSYDLTSPHASVDVSHDDLPGSGNPAHRTTPVFVLNEGSQGDGNIDEGRAMLQIVHDVAPDAALAFSTTGDSQVTFANNIRAMRTNASAHCDVLVDDIGYPDEPFFSDGVAAKAVDEVVTSGTIAGKKVIYYSAAGNDGDLGYEADFSPVSDSDVRNGLAGANNLKFNQVSSALTAGGWHNFAASSGTNIVQKIIVNDTDAEFDFQWDDLFDANAMTSDYNVLVFDENGNYLSSSSGIDDNFSTGQALELVDLTPNSDGSPRTYQIVITKTSAGTGTAKHFRYLINTDGGVDGTFLQMGLSTIFGHSGARNCDGVGAYWFKKLNEPEDFSSFGPVSIRFDDNGNRLLNPEVRQQPTISGPDGVSTSMAEFKPFFGTSAAAPHLAGVAALLLQANIQTTGTSLTAADMRSILQNTALTHDIDPLTATATLTGVAGTVKLTGYGDGSNFSSDLSRFFALQFSGTTGAELQSISIDLSPAGLTFDPNASLGFPFTVGSTSGGADSQVTTALKAGVRRTANSKLVLTFANFPSGGVMEFGIDRDVAKTHSGGNDADFLAKAIVTATVVNTPGAAPVKLTGTFINGLGPGYTPADGFGFVSANAALQKITNP